MTYIPQPIAIHRDRRQQNFRRGACPPYSNPVVYAAPNLRMPNVLLKRPGGGGTSYTVELYDLNDVLATTLTPPGQSVEPLDEIGENEVLLLEEGNWVGAASLPLGLYYMLIDDGDYLYYSDEFELFDDDGNGFPDGCGEVFCKIEWKLAGGCMFSGLTEADPSKPVHAYPKDIDTDFFVYAPLNASRPDWQYEEKGEEDAHGTFVARQKRLVKQWRLEGRPVSEYVADALTVAALSDDVRVIFPDGEVFAGLKQIRPENTWNLGGCTASFSMIFTIDYFVKQGCC